MPAKKLNHNHKTLPDVSLPRTIHDDLHRLGEVDVPIITISATFRKDIAENLGEKATSLEEAVFSRAHFSMALGTLEQARQLGLTSWLVDPTNYVSGKAWEKVLFIEKVAEIVARSPFLKKIKDVVDTFARSKLPITQVVKDPLEYVAFNIKKPIISFHYESGNLLAAQGKKVLQVVTDPHVRVNYLFEASRKNITFAVFDKNTKEEFLAKAKKMKVGVDEERVVVTGPPVDPRIIAAREGKNSEGLEKRPLRLVITTGGLGTNKGEIKKILKSLISTIESEEVEVILYAGTHHDFKLLYQKALKKSGIRVRIIHSPSIVVCNTELIKYAFPWADGFITKPSGDMAYDAAAAGCFILSLRPWGEWEENIRKVFSQEGILKEAKPGRFAEQLRELRDSGWIKEAVEKALTINPLFLNGAKKIVDLQQKLTIQ